MKPELRYWDSSVFLAILLPEEARKKQCLEVVQEARAGKLKIVTSAITLTEVIHLKGVPRLNEKDEKKVKDYFLHEYILVVSVDRAIAEEARQLVWKHGAQPKDAIHLATAMRLHVPVLHAFDRKDMLALDGKLGAPPIKITEPSIAQPALPFPEPTPALEGHEEEDETSN